MTKFYATKDNDGKSIQQDASIFAFDSEADARGYLLSGYGPEWDIASAEIGPGSFGDCWIKSQTGPRVGQAWIDPFSFRQLQILRPGQHPGGAVYWITPTPEILVLSKILETE